MEAIKRKVEDICDRLLDSEEHACEEAIPQIAAEAAILITDLHERLAKANAFIRSLADFKIRHIGEKNNDHRILGDEYVKSHTALMNKISEAKKLMM